MLTVTQGSITEPLNKINNFELYEEVNGAFEASFSTLKDDNNPAYDMIEEESIINAEDYEFRVKQLNEVSDRKEVVAISTFFDLVGHRQEDIYGGTRTFNEFANFVFSGTGWTFTSDVNGSILIANFGADNVIKLVQGLCEVYECEFKIMPNNHVHFSKEVGPDNDAQYRYGHNVKVLSKSVDTTNLRTWVRGYGADNLVVTYVSPMAEIFGTENKEADPVYDDRFTIGENLVDYIKRGLVDYPEVSLELDAVELTDKELGERVWLIYEPLDIEFKTRVLAKTSTLREGELVTLSVVLGNSMPTTLDDILASQKVEIDENKKQVMSRIEQVNDRVTVEVEEVGSSIAGLEVRVGEVEIYAEDLEKDMNAKFLLTTEKIEMEVNGAKEYTDVLIGDVESTASTNFTVLSNAIDASVEETKEYTDLEIGKVETNATSNFNVLAGRINAKADYSEITALGTRVNSVEWDVDAVRGQMSSKVSTSDYNGSTIASLINQTAYNVSIDAQAIDLSGIVRVADSIELGHSSNGQTKAIKFNGNTAWIYSNGDNVTLSAPYVIADGRLSAWSPYAGPDMPVITGTSRQQNLSIGLTPSGQLTVYRANGTSERFNPI